MERWPFRIVDVFTDRPLAGNQLAVFEDASDIPEATLQPLAREINFAETVFMVEARSGGDARIRIFTPENEVPFAGHPTLGSAVVLAAQLGKDRVVLETGRGMVPVRIETTGAAARGVMEQPIPTVAPYPNAPELLRALGVERFLLPVTVYDNGIAHVYVMLADPADVATLEPDLAAVARLARDTDMPLIGVTVVAGSGTTWKTRMFAPADGVPEDAATGSAAGPLALHLVRRERIPWGTEIRISQGVEIGRPSELFARVLGDAGHIDRVEVSGYAVPVGGGWFDAALLRAELFEI